jgi:mono/diheme cytochrome c family protein
MRVLLTFLSLAVSLGAGRAADPKSIERGRYLAVEVAKCQECHTPKDEKGQFDQTRWMKGAVLDFAPLQPVPGWHKTSPDLTPGGSLWRKWGEGALVKYMMTGLTPKGTPADPPMPAYKLTKEDAEAIVDYLKSLK